MPWYFATFAKKRKNKFPNKLQNRGIEFIRVTWVLSWLEPQETIVRFWTTTFEIVYRKKFCSDQTVNTFWTKMLKFWTLSTKFSKTSVRFVSNIFEIEYKQNFVETLESWYFLPKIPKFGHLGSKFEKRKIVQNSIFPKFWNFESFGVVSQLFFGYWASFYWFRFIFTCSGF